MCRKQSTKWAKRTKIPAFKSIDCVLGKVYVIAQRTLWSPHFRSGKMTHKDVRADIVHAHANGLWSARPKEEPPASSSRQNIFSSRTSFFKREFAAGCGRFCHQMCIQRKMVLNPGRGRRWWRRRRRRRRRRR